MSKVLINYGHRDPTSSKHNSMMVDAVRDLPNVTINDLKSRYPDYQIDGDRERELLLAHDIVVLQFPFYWYSTPAILKEWQDETLSYGFAYGSNGNRLHGKSMLVAMTTGGPEDAYQEGGYNYYTFDQLLTPLHATANLTGMKWLWPFISAGVIRKTTQQFELEAAEYRECIRALTETLN